MPPVDEDDSIGPSTQPDSGAPTDVISADGVEARLYQRFRLVVAGGPDVGTSFTSTGERAIVGTHGAADLRLFDRTVSRFHCELSLQGGRAVVRDLGSRNGTLVDGVSVIHAHLPVSCHLTLGRTQLRFDLGPDHVHVPLSARTRFGSLVGGSVAARALYASLERAAAHDATVLLEGETGTGKEAAARSIHAESRRREQPFVVVDCGAIPPELLESELFGHERGAFTGATGAREGVFEAAAGGTIFLDEIGELPADLQPKLLRVLEAREVKRLGSTRYQPVDVRVIAATNRDLRAEVNAKRFRSDLYYRLAVMTIRLPPLRERREDMAALVEDLLAQLGAPGERAFGEAAFLAELERHSWPGNVRELRNYLERCLVYREAPPPPIAGVDEGAGLDIDVGRPLRVARDELVRRFERAYLVAIVARYEGNISAAARAAGLDRARFYRLMWRHGIR